MNYLKDIEISSTKKKCVQFTYNEYISLSLIGLYLKN